MRTFTDPIAQVVIKNPKTGDEWDWTAPNYPFLTGVTLMYEFQRLASVEIAIDAPYQDAMDKILIKNSPFTIGNLIKARIGYASGDFTPWAAGNLQAGGDGLSLDANGIGGSVKFQGISMSAFDTVDKSLPVDGTDEEMLVYIAGIMGFELVLGENAVYSLVGKSAGRAVLKTRSAWEILKTICTEVDLRWFIGPDPKDMQGSTRKLFVVSEAELNTLQPKNIRRTYVIRGVVDETNNQYPCTAWTPEGASFATWLADLPDPAARGTENNYIDVREGKVVEVIVKPKDLPEPIMGVNPVIEPTDIDIDDIFGDKAKTDGRAAKYDPFPVEPGADGKAAAKKKVDSKVAAGNPAQRGNISCPVGLPEETPGTMCYLRGAGEVYDDLYHVQKLSQIYTIGSWSMSMGVFRRGTGGGEVATKQEETAGGQMS